MRTFVCGHCGASLDIPEDETVVDVCCGFCGRHTMLPRDILALRSKKAPPGSPSRPAVLVPAIGALVVVAGGVTALSMMSSRPAPSRPPTTTKAAEGLTPRATPVEASSTPPATSTATGAAEASQVLQRLYADGCKDVILPPTQSSGAQTVETKLVMNGKCVTVVAVSGSTTNELTLTMKTPLGVPLSTPPKASEVTFSVCPKMAGIYPTTIVPTGTSPYTVAAIECPAPHLPMAKPTKP